MTSTEGLFGDLSARIEEIISGRGLRDDKLMAICRLLQAEVPHYDWVGFYIVDGVKQRLLLGPYIGQPTAHVEIPFGRGICGMAAEKKSTLMVPDVSEVLNYLSCSPEVKSEMVVPILKEERMVAELDIDSHALKPFTKEDRAFLEGMCLRIAELF